MAQQVIKGRRYVILYAGRHLRGFHRHILADPPPGIEYKTQGGGRLSFFETKSWHAKILSRVWHSKIGDWLGLIQCLHFSDESQEGIHAVQTFNRFAVTKVPYVIYLENPTALAHYEPDRIQSRLGRHRIMSFFQDRRLKAIVCMSRICMNTLDKVIPFIPHEIERIQIYPYIPSNPKISADAIEKRCEDESFKCLYISSDFRLKGGKEIIKAIEKLIESGMHNIRLTIITNKDSIPGSTRKQIEKYIKNITVLDFNQQYSTLQNLYASSHVLLHPTLKDSFGMVVLEAIKSGLPVIGTSVYAIPEMIHDGINGFLRDPAVWYFTPDGLPNMTIWGNERAIIDRQLDESMVNFLAEKIALLNENRKLWLRLASNSWEIATTGPFSRETIHQSWAALFDRIIG